MLTIKAITPLAGTVVLAGAGVLAPGSASATTEAPPPPTSVEQASPGYRLPATATGLAWDMTCTSCDRYVYADNELRWIVPGWDAGSGAEHAHAIPHLGAGETHELTVRNRDRSGNLSAPSNPVVVSVPETTDSIAPTTPTNLELLDDGGMGGAYLGIGASSDNVDAVTAVEYEVTISSPRYTYMMWLDYGLKDFAWIPYDGQTYTLTVRAFDRSANASDPASLQVQM